MSDPAAPVNAEITDTTTGEMRVFVCDFGFSGDFIWSDGNFACDCNRHQFFEEAAGIITDDDDYPCGHERFFVKIKGPHGQILYSDDAA